MLISQIIRSASSVEANVAEGFGRYKTKEYERFLQIALGSANETEYWLLILKDSYPAFAKEIESIIAYNQESIKMIAASIHTLRKNKKSD